MATKREKQKRLATLRPHPVRDQIVDVMRSYGKPISPTRISRITGGTLGSVAYHVRTLAAAGVIELADEGRVRGAVEHLYLLVPERDDAAARRPGRQPPEHLRRADRARRPTAATPSRCPSTRRPAATSERSSTASGPRCARSRRRRRSGRPAERATARCCADDGEDRRQWRRSEEEDWLPCRMRRHGDGRGRERWRCRGERVVWSRRRRAAATGDGEERRPMAVPTRRRIGCHARCGASSDGRGRKRWLAARRRGPWWSYEERIALPLQTWRRQETAGSDGAARRRIGCHSRCGAESDGRGRGRWRCRGDEGRVKREAPRGAASGGCLRSRRRCGRWGRPGRCRGRSRSGRCRSRRGRC